MASTAVSTEPYAVMKTTGHPRSADTNGMQVEGIGPLDQTIHRGERMSAARAYLEPVADRPNLSVRSGCTVHRVVFDGPRPAPEAEAGAGPRVVFAPDADAWLLARVGEAEDPSRLQVVTADRRLAARARHRGANVVAPNAFLRRCG